MRGARTGLALAMSLAAVALALGARTAEGQTAPRQSEARRMSVSWSAVPIRDVLRAIAIYSGSSVVAGPNVSALVTAEINDQPWDVALATILSGHGLIAVEDEYGIIRVENMADVSARELVEPLVTRSYRISYQRAPEIEAAIAPLLSGRGSASVVASTNTVVVTDVARVQSAVSALIR